ncbi:MAG: TIGR03088 family PEP-CTERM/XrtA system glycosyltransferase [Alphaproteobacteria bacterium]
MTNARQKPPDERKPARDAAAPAPLVAHVIHRLDFGGMENGLVNLINRTPARRYRHAVVCLTGYTEFRQRITRAEVPVVALGKRHGKDVAIYAKLWRLLRRLRPAIVHTRNLPAVDMAIPAALAGVRCRVHGEHGRDVTELAGGEHRYRRLRRALSPFVDRYIPLSRELEDWLVASIGVPPAKITRIYNGVDGARFHPAQGDREPLPADGFAPPGTVVIGAVGRMETVKDQPMLARAFVELLDRLPAARGRLRLVMIGDGTLRAEAMAILDAAGAADLAWLPGSRNDAPALYRGFDVFALPSRTEGISNTILEAMASGLPVVATRVGGNPELVDEGVTGALAPPGDPAAFAGALRAYVADPALRRAHGRAARARIEREFDLDAMVARYLAVYDAVLAAKGVHAPAGASR